MGTTGTTEEEPFRQFGKDRLRRDALTPRKAIKG